jgi:hypothetical protein
VAHLGRREHHLDAGLGGRGEGYPPEGVEGHVVGDLEAEDVAVEAQRLLVVGDGDEGV